MKRLKRLAVLMMMTVVLAPLAGCGGAKTAPEGAGSEMLDPATMMDASKTPDRPDGKKTP